jgi:hypothetical protein
MFVCFYLSCDPVLSAMFYFAPAGDQCMQPSEHTCMGGKRHT